MKWSLRKINNKIEVYFGSSLKGVYELLKEPFCHFCAHSGATKIDCSWHHNMYGFERIYAMGKYVPVRKRASEDLLSYHILMFKNNANYAYPLGKGIEVTVRSMYSELLEATLLVPIPLVSERLKERGFNQSLELAKVLGDSLNIPVRELLHKTRNINFQGMTWEQRKEAVKGLYVLGDNSDEAEGERVLLIDDVVASGFTVSECASALLKCNPVSVNILVAGRTLH